MKSIVYEYFTENINELQYIKRWQIHSEEERPDLKDNPIPLIEMNETLYDENGKLKYVLTDEKTIVINIQDLNEQELAEKGFELKYILRKILKILIVTSERIANQTNSDTPELDELIQDLTILQNAGSDIDQIQIRV